MVPKKVNVDGFQSISARIHHGEKEVIEQSRKMVEEEGEKQEAEIAPPQENKTI